jgi:DNA-binding HxlR family transcriptional regulator
MRDAQGDRTDFHSDLRELVSRPHVVELLDALSCGPMTLAQIRSAIPGTRRALASALRVVAARGLVVSSDNGSWDSSARVGTQYRQTDRGRLAVQRLSQLSVWTTMLAGPDTVNGSRPTSVPQVD